MSLLPIYAHTEEKRISMRRKAIEGMDSLFPVIGNKYDMHISDAKVDPRKYSMKQYKDAILSGRSVTEPMTATVTIQDKSGNVVDRKKDMTMAKLPYMTDHDTFIVKGNSYSVSNQLRTKSGIYTRIRRNEVPEVAFNLERGSNFKLLMDPSTSVFKMELGSSKIPLYAVLKGIGVSDSIIRTRWGSDILSKNSGVSTTDIESAITKLYDKVVPYSEKNEEDDHVDKVRKVKGYFKTTRVDPKTTLKTLGRGYSHIGSSAILDASKKLLQVFKKEVDHDDRDSLEFQTAHSVDDFMKERLQKSGRELTRKYVHRLDTRGGDISKVIGSMPLAKPVESLITQYSLSRTPDQINPLEIRDAAMKVTRMGEGGISTLRAVPEATRDLHTSHLGILDPVRSPESSSIGVDVRFAMNTAKDDNGNLYSLVRDVRTGKVAHVSADLLRNRVLAFPGQSKLSKVEVVKDGIIETVPKGQVDYEIANTQSMFGPSASLLPFIDNMQGNRALMGAKQLTQALPLVHRESPLIQVSAPEGSKFSSIESMVGSEMTKSAPEDGVVSKVDDEFIYFKGKSGKTHHISYANDYPLNSKTYIHEDVIVPIGSRVKKGTRLTDSNYTKNGDLALGINARVAYMAYHGDNTNDSVVISEGAAKRLTSQHMYKKLLEEDNDTKIGKSFWLSQFPNKHTPTQLSNIDKDGLPIKGSRINYGDPLMLATTKSKLNAHDLMLGKLHTSFKKKYKDAALTWDKEHPGVITDVVRNGGCVQVTVKSEAPMMIGDKLSNKYGNKGVVSKIVPDDQMVQDSFGNPIDILVAPTGVVSRINPGQLLENALGKVADKTGNKITIDNFDPTDRVASAKKILKAHGVSDTETVFDPMTGKKIKNINVGKQQILKLFKSTDTNFGSRGLGSYDINQQPVRGGTGGSKRIGGMELNALLAHGANDFIKETSRLKSQKNDEWWSAYKQGLPLPALKRSFVTDKLVGMLAGSGINVREQGDKVQLTALTDAEISRRSNGTIEGDAVLRKKDLKPEIGGLFDPVKTGGLEGEKWSDLTLSEPVIRPAFKKPAASILGISISKLEDIARTSGGRYIQHMLKAVDLLKLKDKTILETETATGQKLNNAVKRLKYIRGLESTKLTPHDAYVGSKVAVLPPKMRPIVPGPNGQLLVADANHLYRDIILADKSLINMKKAGFTEPEDLAGLRSELSNSVSALAGLSEPNSFKLQQQGKKGFIKQIAGTRPADGYYQEKIYGRPQDLSGRGTIAPDPTLRMDEIGLPEDTAWGIYKPFVTKRMVGMGYNALEAVKHVEDRSPVARRSLVAETEGRPLVFNRAPTLWRYGMFGAYPKLVPGKTIRMSPFTEKGLNSDYDGDCCVSWVLANFNNKTDLTGQNKMHSVASNKTTQNAVTSSEKEGNTMLKSNTPVISSWQSIHISEFPRIEDSKVIKENGNEEYDVPGGVTVYAYNTDKKCIEEAPVSKFSIHKNLKAYYMKTNRGRDGIFSENKAIFAINDKTLIPEEVATMKSVGKLIPRRFGDLTGNLETVDLAKYFVKKHKDVRNTTQTLDTRFGWFLGLIIGEGWGTTNPNTDRDFFCFAKKDLVVRNEVISCMQGYSSRNPYIHEQVNKEFSDGKYTSVKVTYGSSDYGTLIPGMIGKGCRNKHLPDFTFQANKDFLWGMLSGLIEGDGTFVKVKAKAKKNPQFMCAFDSSSERLANEVLALCTGLGVEAGINTYNGTETGVLMYHVQISPWHLALHNKIKFAGTQKREAWEEYTSGEFDEFDTNVAKTDFIPINGNIARSLKLALPVAGDLKGDTTSIQFLAGIKGVLRRVIKSESNRIGRLQMMRYFQFVPQEEVKEIIPLADAFLAHYNNKEVRWDYVKEVTKQKTRVDMYDLSVPGYDTFMLTNQLIAYDTVQLHVPVGAGAVQDVKNMTLDRILFSDKTRSDLLAKPEMEAVSGLYEATRLKSSGKKFKFKNKEEAMKAYYSGTLKSNDEVEIG